MNVLGKKKYKLYLPKSLVLIGVLLSIIIRKPLFTMDNYYGLIQDTTASTEKIKKEFGFKPIKLEEGLKRSLLQ
jgi:nucleoside-diphosphate-sugar epimerase